MNTILRLSLCFLLFTGCNTLPSQTVTETDDTLSSGIFNSNSADAQEINEPVFFTHEAYFDQEELQQPIQLIQPIQTAAEQILTIEENIESDENIEIHQEEPQPEELSESEPFVYNWADQETRAEQIMRAFAEAYPRQIDKVEFRNDDWAVLLRGIWFYYAEGKMLPENRLEYAANYGRYSFYYYPKELPRWTPATPEQVARYLEWEARRESDAPPPPGRSPYFYDTLWRIHNREEAELRMQTIDFLGRRLVVHYMIMENLALVEQEILEAARTNRQVQTWVTAVRNTNTYNASAYFWRNIAASQSRSLHSYGIAIDIFPRRLGRLQTYWLWSAQANLRWWEVTYAQRYHPPDAVVKAFEKYGFLWGGKWTQFDTMHFEYRPELLVINGMPPEMRR